MYSCFPAIPGVVLMFTCGVNWMLDGLKAVQSIAEPSSTRKEPPNRAKLESKIQH